MSRIPYSPRVEEVSEAFARARGLPGAALGHLAPGDWAQRYATSAQPSAEDIITDRIDAFAETLPQSVAGEKRGIGNLFGLIKPRQEQIRTEQESVLQKRQRAARILWPGSRTKTSRQQFAEYEQRLGETLAEEREGSLAWLENRVGDVQEQYEKSQLTPEGKRVWRSLSGNLRAIHSGQFPREEQRMALMSKWLNDVDRSGIGRMQIKELSHQEQFDQQRVKLDGQSYNVTQRAGGNQYTLSENELSGEKFGDLYSKIYDQQTTAAMNALESGKEIPFPTEESVLLAINKMGLNWPNKPLWLSDPEQAALGELRQLAGVPEEIPPDPIAAAEQREQVLEEAYAPPVVKGKKGLMGAIRSLFGKKQPSRIDELEKSIRAIKKNKKPEDLSREEKMQLEGYLKELRSVVGAKK